MITNPSADQLTCGFPKNKNKTAGKTHHPLFAKYKDSPQKGTLHPPYQAGDTIGPYHLTLIERKHDAKGRLTDRGTFLCPRCQAIFETTITSVRRGQKRFCNQCTSQKRYYEGNYYGSNQDILLVELAQTAQDKDKWECPYCHTYFYASRYLIGNGKITSCGCYRAQCSSERFTKDLTGQTFGRLYVLGIDTEYEQRYRNPKKPGSHIWLCQCDCGNVAHVRSNQLRTGNTQSCGCLQREREPLRPIRRI